MMATTPAPELLEAVRTHLRTHPGSSKKRLHEAVEGGTTTVDAAFQYLVDAGEAIYTPPARPGKAGRCALRNGNGAAHGPAAPEAPPTGPQWKPTVTCPRCGLGPPVRFTEREVQRARLDRQGTHLQNVRCGRCRTEYWIQARHVAAATLDNGRRVP